MTCWYYARLNRIRNSIWTPLPIDTRLSSFELTVAAFLLLSILWSWHILPLQIILHLKDELKKNLNFGLSFGSNTPYWTTKPLRVFALRGNHQDLMGIDVPLNGIPMPPRVNRNLVSSRIYNEPLKRRRRNAIILSSRTANWEPEVDFFMRIIFSLGPYSHSNWNLGAAFHGWLSFNR